MGIWRFRGRSSEEYTLPVTEVIFNVAGKPIAFSDFVVNSNEEAFIMVTTVYALWIARLNIAHCMDNSPGQAAYILHFWPSLNVILSLCYGKAIDWNKIVKYSYWILHIISQHKQDVVWLAIFCQMSKNVCLCSLQALIL